MNTVRVATVKATGRKYIVQYIDFQTNKVHCWGEVFVTSERKGTKHDGTKAFILSAVDVQNDVPFNDKLMGELFEQTRKVHATDIATGKLRISVRHGRR